MNKKPFLAWTPLAWSALAWTSFKKRNAQMFAAHLTHSSMTLHHLTNVVKNPLILARLHTCCYLFFLIFSHFVTWGSSYFFLFFLIFFLCLLISSYFCSTKPSYFFLFFLIFSYFFLFLLIFLKKCKIRKNKKNKKK